MNLKIFLLGGLLLLSTMLTAQEKPNTPWSEETFSGLKMRSIGPALMAGRIADIAIHPTDPHTWYVAVGSGGVWKTENAGITWNTLFDKQAVYSTGCITIDPINTNTIWVGTGENVGGRHVGYGDGIYKSIDGGKTWENMGLKNSEHISKIIVHPSNSNIIWVAVQGPLWSQGGDRGLYKSIDGGKTWNKTLGDKKWIGVTDIVMDPRNPDLLYAATWQRHRTVAAYIGGGPGSGIHRSFDGGASWEQLKNGLPESNLGKIGLVISPQRPDFIYAAIELDRRSGGVYRSTDRGSNWEKQSDAFGGGTGPHYYTELYACPHNFDRLYLPGPRVQISDNGGKTWRWMKEDHKHGDTHAITFRPDDPDYILTGTDGGIYETFDGCDNWRFIDNMPITQFYKLAVDDAEPFYNIYGGTQDNSTQGGPSRTDNIQGIQNMDWRIVLNWDGHQPAAEPGNPNIIYGQRQEGTLSRIDMLTGEVTDVQPQPGVDEDYERFNWDAPIFISPHSPTRVYFASQRLWKSNTRGDSWEAISPDLTRDQERLELPIMGKKQSWDNPWDFLAMSNYNTITSIAESPKQEGLLYIGTDDGLIQISENGGADWRKIEVGTLPGVPGTAYVNDIKADLFDVNTVYVALDNHKYGDFQPYLVKSTDRGNTWQSIRGNLPDRTLVWRLVQDHQKAGLLFVGTEFGIFFTPNGGKNWVKITGDVPTISFRDLAIQRRENDLVGASFGRSFYVFDDYSVLREVNDVVLAKEAALFSTRKAWWYFPRPHLSFGGAKGTQGAMHYVAPNPPFGAVFTYYLKEDLKTKKQERKEAEKDLAKNNQDISFPGWEEVEAEQMEQDASIILVVTDASGQVIRRLKGPAKKGFHRVSWDLRYPSPRAIDIDREEAPNSSNLMVAPGTYSVTLYKVHRGTLTHLSEPQSFEVVPLRKGALEGSNLEDVLAFWREYEAMVSQSTSTSISLQNAMKKAKGLEQALANSAAMPGELDQQVLAVQKELLKLNAKLNGNQAKVGVGEKTKPTVGERLFAVARTVSLSTYGPTKTSRDGLDIVKQQLNAIQTMLREQQGKLSQIAQDLREQGGPWIEGEPLPKKN